MKFKSFLRKIIYWIKQATFSWITYVALGCIVFLFSYIGLTNTFLSIAGGIVASSIFYFFLVKIPQTRYAHQMSGYTKNLYIYKKNIIATIIDKSVPADRHHLEIMTGDPKILAEYLALESHTETIFNNLKKYKNQILNELSFLFLIMTRYVNLEFVSKDIELFNITNDYINFLENINLSLTTLETYSDNSYNKEQLIKTLTELLCGCSLLLSDADKDFFLKEVSRYA